MITEKDIEIYKSASDTFGAAKETIVNRMDEVIKVISKVFKNNKKDVNCWWFYNAPEGGVGDFDSCVTKPYCKDGYDEIGFERHIGCRMETDDWDYSFSFPRKFLFMSDNDIRSEIKSQIKKTEENVIKAKKKREQDSAAKKKLKSTAAKKLTKEEKKALGIK